MSDYLYYVGIIHDMSVLYLLTSYVLVLVLFDYTHVCVSWCIDYLVGAGGAVGCMGWGEQQ